MSKNKKSSNSKQLDSKTQTPLNIIDTDKSVFVNKSGELCLNIFAKPGAKDSSIVDVQEDAVNVRISAPPVDGEANKELIKFISKIFGLKSSEVNLDKGSRNRNKVLVLSNCKLSVDEAVQLLKSQSDA